MRKAYAFTLVSLTAGLLVAFTPATGSAQGLMGRLKKKAEDAAKGKIEQRTDAAVDSAVNKVDCSVPGNKCDPAKNPATTSEKTGEESTNDDGQSSSSRTSESVVPRLATDSDDDKMFESGKGYSVSKVGVTYRLTAKALKGFLAAGKKLEALAKSDPQAVDDSKGTKVNPKLKAVFTESGITPEEYANFFTATLIALDYRGTPVDPTDRVSSSPVLRANLAFIDAHPREFKDMIATNKNLEAEMENAFKGAAKK